MARKVMVTDKNYFLEIERMGTTSLPDTLRKGHDFVVKSTGNGSSWDTYRNNDTIRKVINLYFEKLNQYLGSQSPSIEQQERTTPRSYPVPKQQVTTSTTRNTSPPAKPKQQRKVSVKAGGKSGKKVEHIREEIKFIKRFVEE